MYRQWGGCTSVGEALQDTGVHNGAENNLRTFRDLSDARWLRLRRRNTIETVKYNSRDIRRGSQKNDWDLSGNLREAARSLSLEPPRRRIC
jgi:hypothetical protein